MKKMFQLVAVAAVLMLTATFAFSQKAERLSFKRGARQTIAAGILSGYRSRRTFVIRVRRGQTLRVEQLYNNASNHPVTVAVTDPNGEDVTDSDASCNNRKEVSPTAAGDYRITVVECRKADAWRGGFRLKVRVD